MVLLTPRFAALLILISSVNAAFVPYRAGPQVHFHARSTPEVASKLYDTYTSALQAFRRNPLFLQRRSSAGKKSAPGKKPKAKTTAPVPESAKPASERKASAQPSAVNNAAAGKHGVHTPGQHHRESKGGKHAKPKGHRGHKSKGHKSGHMSKGHKGHKDHKGKRSLAGSPRANSRLFSRLWAKKNAALESRHEHDHDHYHGHDHDHYHGHEHRHRDLDLELDDGLLGGVLNLGDGTELNLKRGHDDDDDDDDDKDGHHHHHHHHHHARDFQSEDDNRDLVDVEVQVNKRGHDDHHHHHHHHHPRQWEDADLLDVDVEANLNLKRGHDEHHHGHHHHHHNKKDVANSHQALVLYDVGHKNFGKLYHVHGRRDLHRRISGKIHARNHHHGHHHDHDHDHEHIHEHVHEHKHVHKHGRRGANVGTRVPGSIMVVSPKNDGGHVKIANLVVSSANSTAGAAPSNASFVLNASNDTHTQVFLVAADTSPDGKAVHASLQVDMFNAAEVSVVPNCVTYDPSPQAPGPLTVAGCGQSSTHQSQMFEYTPATGTVRPMWVEQPAADVEAASAMQANALPANGTAANSSSDATAASSANSTASSTANSTATSTSAAPASTASSDASAAPRTVALMFQPDDPQESKAAAESESDTGAGYEGTPPASGAAQGETTFYPQASGPDNSTSTTVLSSTTMGTTTAVTTTTMDAAAALSTSSALPSTTAAPTTSASDAVSSTAASTAAAADVTASEASSTASESSTTVASAEATTTAQAVDAAAPYEYMFTPTAHL